VGSLFDFEDCLLHRRRGWSFLSSPLYGNLPRFNLLILGQFD